jgi:anti-sigma-K factor RskA
MIDERHEELACLHTLELLEGEDRLRFQNELAGNPELQGLARSLLQPAALLAFLAPPVAPPDGLKTRILASMAAAGPREARVLSVAPSHFRRWVPWGLAAGFAGAAAWLGQLHLSTRSESELLRTQAEIAAVAQQSFRQQVEADRILRRHQFTGLERQNAESMNQLAEARTQLAAREQRIAQLADDLKSQADLARLKITALASLLENTPKALAVAVWDPGRQEGLLQVEKLPPLAPHQDYQLWVVDPQYPNPVDGGVFRVNPGTGDARLAFKAKQSIRSVSAFAVTLERKGGVRKAEGPFVLLGK